MRLLGSYTKIRRSKSKKSLLNVVVLGIISWYCISQDDTKDIIWLFETHRKHLHCIDILLRSLCRILARVVKLEILEVPNNRQ